MLDIKYILKHSNTVRQNILDRLAKADLDKVLALHEERSAVRTRLDAKRRARNANAKNMKGKLSSEERTALIEEGRSLKEEIASLEAEFSELESEFNEAHSKIPNMTHPEAPRGSGDEDHRELYTRGTIPTFNFTPLDHIEIGEALDLFDFETAARVSGTKFYYLKNEAVFLEMALLRYTMDKVKSAGFSIFATPDIAREAVVAGTGFNPRGEESNIYKLENSDICLIGTSEITLAAYYSGKTLPFDSLPVKLAGLSHCFRREAGAAGKFSKGLYRVHQFTKLELFVYSKPEDSEAMHEELRNLEEDIFSSLNIPFRVVDTCTADLGASAYRKFDLEAWMPGRNGWGEITSTSNCTDYQARRLNIRYKSASASGFPHLLNGTAIAIPRAIISILENFQEADGSVRIPPALVPYTGFDRIVRK